jgi:hypothetical protein
MLNNKKPGLFLILYAPSLPTLGEWTLGEWTLGEWTLGEWTLGEWGVRGKNR